MSKWRETYKVHPSADTFPMMSDDELAALGKDIVANGLIEPIRCLVDDGEYILIDGRNRLEAAERARILGCDISVQLHGKNDGDVVSFIISKNFHRRHLTKAEQADAIVKAHKASRQVDEVPKPRHVKGKPGSEKDEFKAAVVADATKHDISKSTVERAIAKGKKKVRTREEIIAADAKRAAALAATKERKAAEYRAARALEQQRDDDQLAEFMGLLSSFLAPEEIERVFELCDINLRFLWMEGFDYEGHHYGGHDEEAEAKEAAE